MKGKLIGTGATAEVYEYEEGKVLKLYNTGTKEENVLWEYNKMQQAYQNNLPCPKPYDIVKIEDRIGYTMECFLGVTLKEKMFSDIQNVIFKKSSIDEFSKSFFENIKGTARALSKIHCVKISNWDNLFDQFTRETQTASYLYKDEKDKVLRIINQLTNDENIVCHGDPNPNNIMYCNGEYKFIDWVNAGTGNPLFDIAEYIWLNTPRKEIDVSGVPKELVDFYFNNNHLIIPTFIDEYQKVSGRDISNYSIYMIPLLVRKLHSNRTEQEKNEIVLEIRNLLNSLS